MDFPEKLGECIDLLYTLRQKRLQVKRDMELKIKEIGDQEEELENHIYALFGNDGIEGAKGAIATAGIKHTTVPQVIDWDAFYKFVEEHRAFDLLHKRLTSSAWAERKEAGQEVPGITTFDKVEITLNKR